MSPSTGGGKYTYQQQQRMFCNRLQRNASSRQNLEISKQNNVPKPFSYRYPWISNLSMYFWIFYPLSRPSQVQVQFPFLFLKFPWLGWLAIRLYLPMRINPHRRIFRIYADFNAIVAKITFGAGGLPSDLRSFREQYPDGDRYRLVVIGFDLTAVVSGLLFIGQPSSYQDFHCSRAAWMPIVDSISDRFHPEMGDTSGWEESHDNTRMSMSLCPKQIKASVTFVVTQLMCL